MLTGLRFMKKEFLFPVKRDIFNEKKEIVIWELM